MKKNTHWHILGAGSMGCLWAYYLLKAGHQVTLIAKNEVHEEELLKRLPLTVIINGTEFYSTPEFTCPEKNPSINHLLICLKTYQTESAILPIIHCLHDQTDIVLMQNGMGNHAQLTSLFPKNAIYVAVTTEAAYRKKILCIDHTGFGTTQLGVISHLTNPRLLDLIQCDLSIQMKENIDSILWQKLVISCCINPLTVIFNCKNGELENNEKAQHLIFQIIAECRQVATVMQKQAYLNTIEKQLIDVIHSTANNTSSMLQDYQNNRSTEIADINGFIVNLGKQHNIRTPINEMLFNRVKQRNKKG